jgi:hypothetical protein
MILISGNAFNKNASSSRAGFSSSTMMVLIAIACLPGSQRQLIRNAALKPVAYSV